MFHLSVSAGFIVRTYKSSCSDCIDDISRRGVVSSDSLIGVKNRGGLVVPCALVMNLCELSEAAIRVHVNQEGLTPKSTLKILTNILTSFLDLRLHQHLIKLLYSCCICVQRYCETVFAYTHEV